MEIHGGNQDEKLRLQLVAPAEVPKLLRAEVYISGPPRGVPRFIRLFKVQNKLMHTDLVMLNSNFFQNRNSNPKNRLKLETCFLLYPSSMVKRVRISTFDFHSRFVDRRSVRSAHIKRSEDLTCARSDSDSCVAATRRVRLTDAFTTVRLTLSISPPQ